MNNLKNKQTELLAPAKDFETAVAAIECGADAVYIGAPAFGARQAASNSLEDVEKLVIYAHKFNVKVHVTLNTILRDDELPKAVELIEKLYNIGVDALIVQDMGLVNLAIKEKLPPIVLHMSTQCDNRSLDKVKFFESIGASRVILARELSLDTIREICKNTNLEIETFVHGALCVSYSGQCYLSFSIGGRSANRGECAQPCRKKYTLFDGHGNVIAKDKYLLSLKDFNASKYLSELVSAGVKSFKIEGRLKDKNYVKNVVLNYRKELDKISCKVSSGKVFTDFEPDVKKSFNRGFTTYFLNKRERCFNFDSPKVKGEKIGKIKTSGIGWFEFENRVEGLNAQDGICYFEDSELKGCLLNKVNNGRIFINKKVKIPSGTIVFRNFDSKFNDNLSTAKIKRRIGVSFEYSKGKITAIDENNNTASLKIDNLEISKNPQKMKDTFINQLQKTGESDFYSIGVKINSELPFMPISEINNLRRNLLDKLIEVRLQNYRREIQKPLQYAKFIKQDFDYRANVLNSEAKEFYEKCDCNILEPALESQGCFEGKELMRTKHCLKYAFDMCKSPKSLFLADEKGTKYKLKFDCKNCEMIIIK